MGFGLNIPVGPPFGWGGSSGTAPSVIPSAGRHVFVKRNWSDEWKLYPYLFPVQCTEACAPEVPRAVLQYDFGSILREDRTTFATFPARELRKWYVQIRVINPYAGRLQPIWTGVIEDQDPTYDRPSRISGVQQITAFGLAHLFDRQTINKAFIEDTDGTIGRIGHVPTFNERNTRGRGLFGNRSSALFDGAYAFSTKGETWTNRDILKYLLKRFAPPAFTVKLDGQSDVLDDLVDFHQFGGRSLWDAMNELIDRKRGLTFHLAVQESEEEDEDDTIKVVVRTTTPAQIKYGDKSLPANTRVINVKTPTTFPYTHLIDATPVRFTTQDYYDEILVRGERIKVQANFSTTDGSLEEGWETDLEADYQSETGSSEKVRRARSQDKYDAVYSRFVVPRDWDGRCGDGKGNSLQNVLVTAKNDGTIDTKAKSALLLSNKTFLRDTFMVPGVNYSQAVVAPAPSTTLGQNEFTPLIAILFDSQDGTKHNATGQHLLVDKIADAEIPGADQSINVRPLDKDLGFVLGGVYRHYVALNWFQNPEDDIDAAKRTPEFDYDDLIFVAVVEIDERPRVQVKRQIASSENPRTLVIDVVGAEYWHIDSNCIVGIDSNGQLQRVSSSGRASFRDDRNKLRSVAAFAAAWYGRERRAVKIPIHGIGLYAELGTLIRTYDGLAVETPVTARHIDFTADGGAGMTVIETDFAALDVVDMASETNFANKRRRGRLA